MAEMLAGHSGTILYIMAAVGIVGVLAKIVNQITLQRLIKASSNMSKSTHKLMKLVRAKYEQSCMVRSSVENTGVFVEKYLYEYRGFLFRIQTWRQIEQMSIWFSGILAALTAASTYLVFGFNESVYQYIALGLSEMVLLGAITRLSDESYKIKMVKTYMVDYLDNICVFRFRKQRQAEKGTIDVISPENASQQPSGTRSNTGADPRQEEKREDVAPAIRSYEEALQLRDSDEEDERDLRRNSSDKKEVSGGRRRFGRKEKENLTELPINIEGEPRRVERKARDGEMASVKQAEQGDNREQEREENRPMLREEAIRQILEEFLA